MWRPRPNAFALVRGAVSPVSAPALASVATFSTSAACVSELTRAWLRPPPPPAASASACSVSTTAVSLMPNNRRQFHLHSYASAPSLSPSQPFQVRTATAGRDASWTWLKVLQSQYSSQRGAVARFTDKSVHSSRPSRSNASIVDDNMNGNNKETVTWSASGLSSVIAQYASFRSLLSAASGWVSRSPITHWHKHDRSTTACKSGRTRDNEPNTKYTQVQSSRGSPPSTSTRTINIITNTRRHVHSEPGGSASSTVGTGTGSTTSTINQSSWSSSFGVVDEDEDTVDVSAVVVPTVPLPLRMRMPTAEYESEEPQASGQVAPLVISALDSSQFLTGNACENESVLYESTAEESTEDVVVVRSQHSTSVGSRTIDHMSAADANGTARTRSQSKLHVIHKASHIVDPDPCIYDLHQQEQEQVPPPKLKSDSKDSAEDVTAKLQQVQLQRQGVSANASHTTTTTSAQTTTTTTSATTTADGAGLKQSQRTTAEYAKRDFD